MNDQIQTGDRVTAVMAAPANPFGSTQQWAFDVEEIDGDAARGTDHMGDECVIDFSHDVPRYMDSGKSGDVTEVRVHEEHEDGGYWGDRYDVVWSDDD